MCTCAARANLSLTDGLGAACLQWFEALFSATHFSLIEPKSLEFEAVQ